MGDPPLAVAASCRPEHGMGGDSVTPTLFDSGVASYSSRMGKTTLTESDHLFTEAQAVLAGGVSASMRLHPYLGRPLYVDRGEGPYLYGIDGKRYIDFNMSNGAALLGHDHPGCRARSLLQRRQRGDPGRAAHRPPRHRPYEVPEVRRSLPWSQRTVAL